MSVSYHASSLAFVNGTTQTLTIPAGASAGDLLIAWSASPFDLTTYGYPFNNWLQVDREAGTNMNFFAATKICAGGEPGTTFTFTMGGSFQAEAGVIAVSGTNPMLHGIAHARSASGSAGTVTIPARASTVACYFGAARVSSTTVALSRGTVDSQRTGDTNVGSVTGHEAISSATSVAQTFTATPSGANGFAYGVAIVGEGPPSGNVLWETNTPAQPVIIHGSNVKPAAWILKGKKTRTADSSTTS